MLEKLRALFHSRPRLDDADPAVRRLALDALDDAAEITEVFKNDRDTELRKAALARIGDLAFLEDCLNEDDFLESPLRNDIIARIREVAAPEALIHQHPYLIAASIAEVDDAQSAAESLKLLENSHDLAQAVLGHPRVQIRKAIAETVWHPSHLRALEAQSRGHDKAVNRIAKTRLADLRSAQADAVAHAQAFKATAAAATALADLDPHYVTKRQSIENKLSALLGKARACNEELAQFGEATLPVEEWQSSFPARRVEAAASVDEPALQPDAEIPTPVEDTAPSVAAEASKEELQAIAALVSQLRNPGASAINDLEQRFAAIGVDNDELCERITHHIAAFRRSIELDLQAANLLGATGDSSAGEGSAEAPTVGQTTLRDRRAYLRRQAKHTRKLIRAFEWPQDLIPPDRLTALIESVASQEAELRAVDVEIGARLQQITADLAPFDVALEAGNVKEASRLERRVRDAISELPDDEARHVSASLNDLSARLRRLRDWRDFAVGPKRIELIETMEALPAEPSDAQAQADIVKTLRRSWNALGPLNQRAGDKDLQDRFDSAAERAFEACRHYYEQLADTRKRNLDERRSIVTLLEDYIAAPRWQDADCRDIDKVLRTARAEWRRFHPIDRQAGKDVEHAFNQATETIFTTLKARWEKHETAKRNIIDRAEVIAKSDEPAEARAKSIVDLQAEWKHAGPLPRHRDQKLYSKFRIHCDAVFKDRSESRAERDESFKATETAVKDLSSRIRTIAKNTPIDRSALRELRVEADDLEPMPRRLRGTLEALFEKIDAAIIASHLEQERDEHLSLVRRIRAIDAEIGHELSDWEERAGDAARWFKPRMTAAPTTEDPRQLTIEAEIAAEIDSPEADQTLRLEMQIERLNAEMGRIDRTKPRSRDLLARWCGAPVHDDPTLRARFFDAVEKLAAED